MYDLLIHGYSILPAFVSRELCFSAVKFINYRIGSLSESDASKTDNLVSTMSSDPEILNLYYESGLAGAVTLLLHGSCPSLAASTIVSIFGVGSRIQYDVLPALAQIALRFPQMESTFPSSGEAHPLGGGKWHTDGMDKGDYAPFTLLAGVALSDQTLPYSGNLCVFPGSHYILRDFVRQVAAVTSLIEPLTDSTVSARASLIASKPVLEEPTQILVKTGDVILLHQKLAHRGGPNFNCEVRRMVYFRISHRRHDTLKVESIDNLWLEFEGMSSVL